MIKHEIITGFGRYHSNKVNNNPYGVIGLKGIRKLVDSPKSVSKENGQWIIPSTYHSRDFEEQSKHGEYLFLWADLDHNPYAIEHLSSVIEKIIGADYEIYTTKSATQENQKARVLIPLAEALSPRDWCKCQDILNKLLCEHKIVPDEANKRYAQICYLPNQGKFYSKISKRDDKFFNPLITWRDEINAYPTERTEIAEKTDDYRRLLMNTEITDVRVVGSVIDYKKLPDDCCPKNEGQRNKIQFTFARYLKKHMPDADWDTLRPIVLGWHNHFLDVIGTQNFSETWTDFRRGWAKIKVAYGQGIESIIHSIDLNVPIPVDFIELGYSSNKEFKLLLICKELQLLNGDEPFFLSARKGGELIEYNYSGVAKMLNAFVADGILAIDKPSTRKDATRYRYIWKDF